MTEKERGVDTHYLSKNAGNETQTWIHKLDKFTGVSHPVCCHGKVLHVLEEAYISMDAGQIVVTQV